MCALDLYTFAGLKRYSHTLARNALVDIIERDKWKVNLRC